MKNRVYLGASLAVLMCGLLIVIACGGSAAEPAVDITSPPPTNTPIPSQPQIEISGDPTETASPTATEKPSDASTRPTTKPTDKPTTKPETEVKEKATSKPSPIATATPVPTAKPTPTPTATPEPPLFSVSNLAITPNEPGPGEQILISVVVTNDGKGPGTHDVALNIDGSVVETNEVTLAAGTEGETIFTLSEDTVGTYEVIIEGLTATFSVRQGLFLDVVTPANQTVVTTASIEVQGNTLSTAILSINGSLTAVTASGTFTTTLALEEGVNIIQIVASDLRGNETGEVLTLIYLP